MKAEQDPKGYGPRQIGRFNHDHDMRWGAPPCFDKFPGRTWWVPAPPGFDKAGKDPKDLDPIVWAWIIKQRDDSVLQLTPPTDNPVLELLKKVEGEPCSQPQPSSPSPSPSCSASSLPDSLNSQ